ncbi:MAG: TIGR02281 family clan AA aspartic protease [Parasphingopyxis sp.]|uniref:retropepsin-like aspartic protease family protein n=1 Tax=Parasphingopyxis sp. TaxID=1920299 RepID=UPI0032EDCA0F
MSGNEGVGLIWGIGALVLVVSALGARRMPWGQTIKMALAWIVIFAVGLTGYAFRNDIKAAALRVWHEIDPPEAVAEGETMRIRKSADGHFWVNATIDGHEERFLVDSGASITALSVGAARRAGIETDNGFPMIITTANGPIEAFRGRVADFRVGTIRREDLGIIVAEEFGGMNVIGMNFLSSLSSWSVEGDWLVLTP